MTITEKLNSRKTKKHYSFTQWLGFLDLEFLTTRCSFRVVKQTGEDCWRRFYDDGMTPGEAITEDESNA